MKGYETSPQISLDFQVDPKKQFNRLFFEQIWNDQS